MQPVSIRATRIGQRAMSLIPSLSSRLNLQFIGVQKHDGESALVGSFPPISVGLPVTTIGLFGSDRSGGEQRTGKHSLVTDNSRPRGIAL